jgi:hypothetical protein
MKKFVAACLLGLMFTSLALIDHADAKEKTAHRVSKINSHGKHSHYGYRSTSSAMGSHNLKK